MLYGVYITGKNLIIINKKLCLFKKFNIHEVLLHELVHATGDKARLNRSSLVRNEKRDFLNKNNLEEIIAERSRKIISEKLNLSIESNTTKYISDKFFATVKVIEALSYANVALGKIKSKDTGCINHNGSLVEIPIPSLDLLLKLLLESNKYVKDVINYFDLN